jgi:hypothetical protein
MMKSSAVEIVRESAGTVIPDARSAVATENPVALPPWLGLTDGQEASIPLSIRPEAIPLLTKTAQIGLNAAFGAILSRLREERVLLKEAEVGSLSWPSEGIAGLMLTLVLDVDRETAVRLRSLLSQDIRQVSVPAEVHDFLVDEVSLDVLWNTDAATPVSTYA